MPGYLQLGYSSEKTDRQTDRPTDSETNKQKDRPTFSFTCTRLPDDRPCPP
jgi:hypothetical protein